MAAYERALSFAPNNEDARVGKQRVQKRLPTLTPRAATITPKKVVAAIKSPPPIIDLATDDGDETNAEAEPAADAAAVAAREKLQAYGRASAAEESIARKRRLAELERFKESLAKKVTR